MDTCLLAAAASRRLAQSVRAPRALQQREPGAGLIAGVASAANVGRQALAANQVGAQFMQRPKAASARLSVPGPAITAIQSYFERRPPAQPPRPQLATLSGARAGSAAARRLQASTSAHRRPTSGCKCGIASGRLQTAGPEAPRRSRRTPPEPHRGADGRQLLSTRQQSIITTGGSGGGGPSAGGTSRRG